MKACVEMGFMKTWYEGETVADIVLEMENDQDFECLLRMGQMREDKKGLQELVKLEEFVRKYHDGELTVDDLKSLDVRLSIGNITCHELIE